MNSQQTGLRIAALIFAIFALGHVIRLVYHIQVSLGSFQVPFAVSWIALIVAGILSIWMLRLASQ